MWEKLCLQKVSLQEHLPWVSDAVLAEEAWDSVIGSTFSSFVGHAVLVQGSERTGRNRRKGPQCHVPLSRAATRPQTLISSHWRSPACNCIVSFRLSVLKRSFLNEPFRERMLQQRKPFCLHLKTFALWTFTRGSGRLPCADLWVKGVVSPSFSVPSRAVRITDFHDTQRADPSQEAPKAVFVPSGYGEVMVKSTHSFLARCIINRCFLKKPENHSESCLALERTW